MNAEIRPWPALWTLVLGFFMILVDSTIVSVANPTIMRSLDTTMVMTLWATSAYLLAYAVPLLITGRLGDRFGPRRVYLIGLSMFTIASLLCGLAPSIEMLIAARALQGLGASFMSPQTMAVITRIFAPNERGSAMAIWGVTAGVAMLVGPILGGFLIGVAGWEWIFFINIPVGIIGFFLALKFVPVLPTNAHRVDLVGVVLSAIGTFLIVFGIQEGDTYAWGPIWGPITVWMLIVAGILVLGVFLLLQARERKEPLLPLQIFRDRNFGIGSLTITLIAVATTGMSLPLMFFLQKVVGLTPAESAFLLLPMAVTSIGLAHPIGKLVDARDSRRIATLGIALHAAGLLLYLPMMNEHTPIWVMYLPGFVLGAANAMIWGPLASITTFNLPRKFAGAGSGVYNTTRQLGAVLGSAGMAMLMSSRLNELLGSSEWDEVPPELRAGYAEAMVDAVWLPIIALFLGAMVTLFFAPRPKSPASTAR